MSKIVLCCAAMIAVLSACGGGGVGGSVAPTRLSPAPAGSFNALINTETTLNNRFIDSNLRSRRTTLAQMPTTGRVTYTGTAAFTRDSRPIERTTTNGNTVINRPVPDMAARAVLNADFTGGTISGTIDQFRDQANTALPGSLNLGDARITATSYNAGNVSGTFPVNGTAQPVQGLSHGGQFVGNNAEGVVGSVVFVAPQPGGGSGTQTGSLIAAR